MPRDELTARIGHILDLAMDSKPMKMDELRDLRAMLQRVTLAPDQRLAADVVRRTIDGMQASTYTRELLRAELQQMRQALGDDTAPILERLIIDQIVACYLRMWFAEFALTAGEREGTDPRNLDRFQKTLGRCQARYLRAAESLAKVRRHLQPAHMAGDPLAMAKMNLAADDPEVNRAVAEFGAIFGQADRTAAP